MPSVDKLDLLIDQQLDHRLTQRPDMFETTSGTWRSSNWRSTFLSHYSLIVVVATAIGCSTRTAPPTNASTKTSTSPVMKRSFTKDQSGKQIGATLFGSHLTEASISSLKEHETIVHVTIMECDEFDAAAFKALNDLPALTRLTIQNCSIDDPALVHLDNVTRLKSLSLLNTKVEGSGLGVLTRLEQLVVAGPAIRVDQLKTLGALTELRSLEIGCRDLKVTQIESLPKLSKLSSLRFSRAILDDEAFLALPAIPNLKELEFQADELTDRGIARITAFPRLQSLALARSQVTSAGLSHVASLKHLESLSLEDCTSVTSDGMQHIALLSELHHLTLRGTGVRFAGLTQLAANQKLRELNILTTQASAANLEKLRKLLPNCEIVSIPPNPSG